jgi:hypothetical protein
LGDKGFLTIDSDRLHRLNGLERSVMYQLSARSLAASAVAAEASVPAELNDLLRDGTNRQAADLVICCCCCGSFFS